MSKTTRKEKPKRKVIKDTEIITKSKVKRKHPKLKKGNVKPKN